MFPAMRTLPQSRTIGKDNELKFSWLLLYGNMTGHFNRDSVDLLFCRNRRIIFTGLRFYRPACELSFATIGDRETKNAAWMAARARILLIAAIVFSPESRADAEGALNVRGPPLSSSAGSVPDGASIFEFQGTGAAGGSPRRSQFGPEHVLSDSSPLR